jgi:hypothetical protein
LKRRRLGGEMFVLCHHLTPRRPTAMLEATTTTSSFPSTASRDVLTEVLRSGAQRLLATAIESEVEATSGQHRGHPSNSGRQPAVASTNAPSLCHRAAKCCYTHARWVSSVACGDALSSTLLAVPNRDGRQKNAARNWASTCGTKELVGARR